MNNARIMDGDIVFIRQQPEVENGEIAAVAIDDEATLKRFYRDEETGTITLLPKIRHMHRWYMTDQKRKIFGFWEKQWQCRANCKIVEDCNMDKRILEDAEKIETKNDGSIDYSLGHH